MIFDTFYQTKGINTNIGFAIKVVFFVGMPKSNQDDEITQLNLNYEDAVFSKFI